MGKITKTRAMGKTKPPSSVAPGSHALGGAQHVADVLADLNTKISDATLLDTIAIQFKTGALHSASEHHSGGALQVNHDSLLGFVSLEHLLVAAIDHDSLLNYIANEHLLVGAIDHNSLLNYAANKHVVLPGTIANVLSDHDLTRHGLAIIPTMNDAHIPDLEGLSYSGAFNVAQIPTLSCAKISDIPTNTYANIFGTTFAIATVLSDHDKAAHDALGIYGKCESVATDPAADAAHLGLIVLVRSGADNKTFVKVCVLNDANGYEWIQIGVST